MVSLTSLLVLATFFTQTSQTIPKTAYLKLIDVWFVALICEDFFIIMAVVLVEWRVGRERDGVVRVAPVKAFSATSLPKRGGKPAWASSFFSPARINSFFIRLFSVTLFLVLACFVPICIHSLDF